MSNAPLHFRSSNGSKRPPALRGSRTPPLRLGDLIPRPSLQIEEERLRRYLSNRTVLVTGAGGSIGSTLSSKLLHLQPDRLLLIDMSEHNLFQLEQSLRPLASSSQADFHLLDVRNQCAMEALFDEYQPHVVLHAAAYKHVPIMERHPVVAVQNNTMAAIQTLDLSIAYEADQFVLVSTDKAVEPTSVLGATKRLAEWYLRMTEAATTRKAVRFGNVFGSRGSVVPRFEQQLAEGGPVRVTHPDMERYFMTADEACRLLLQTLLLDDAPVYALRMGDPVRIRWLAEQVIRHYLPDRTPDELIVYTRPRPGEKLSEELYAATETVTPTAHPAILGLTGPAPLDRAILDRLLRELDALTQQQASAALKERLLNATSTAADPPHRE